MNNLNDPKGSGEAGTFPKRQNRNSVQYLESILCRYSIEFSAKMQY